MVVCVYLMMITKTLSLKIQPKFEKGADFMKVILFYVVMVAE